MKYPEYDSPFELMMSDAATQIARSTDEISLKMVQKVGIDVDKEKLLSALEQDAKRYREAYAKGYETGREERDEEIVRCKDCTHMKSPKGCVTFCEHICKFVNKDWYCADGERKEADPPGEE